MKDQTEKIMDKVNAQSSGARYVPSASGKSYKIVR